MTDLQALFDQIDRLDQEATLSGSMNPTTCQAAVVITKGLIRCPNQAVDNRFCKLHVEKFKAQEKTV